jgi:hypothetical protein
MTATTIATCVNGAAIGHVENAVGRKQFGMKTKPEFWA